MVDLGDVESWCTQWEMHQTAADMFGQEPLPKDCVHLVIRDDRISGATTRSEEDIGPPRKRVKLTSPDPKLFDERNAAVRDGQQAPAPSTVGANPQSEQGSRPIYYGRPADKIGPGIEAYHPVFADFLGNHSDHAKLTHKDYVEISKLITACAEFYPNEATRQDKVNNCLHSILGFRPSASKEYGNTSNDGVNTILCIEDAYALLAIYEYKPEIGMGDGDALTQVVNAFRKFWVKTFPELVNLRNVCCCPGFLVVITGPFMSIWGGIFINQFVVQPLTETIYLGATANAEVQLRSVGRVLAAFKAGLNTLQTYYKGLTPSSTPLPSALFPCYNTFEHPTTHEMVTLQYTKRLVPFSPRAVFEALFTWEKITTRVVVKFCDRYNIDAHCYLASKNLAPRVWYHKQLPDDLWMIVMDFIEQVSYPDPKDCEQCFTDISDAMELLHGKDWVFGDLRIPNVMVYKGKAQATVHSEDGRDKINTDEGDKRPTLRAMLIDFDWCGEDGKACYPITLNFAQISWPNGVGKGAIMKKEHDRVMLERIRAGGKDFRMIGVE